MTMVRVYVAGSNMRGIYYRKEWLGGWMARRGGEHRTGTKLNQIDPRNGKQNNLDRET